MSLIIQQIQDNAIVNLRINDGDEYLIDHVYNLIDALSKNTSVETIQFQGEYLGCVRSDARSELVQMVSKLPNLNEVHMNNSLVLISDITKMLSCAKALRVLKINGVVLQGVAMDFAACEIALYQHILLKEFEMLDCTPAVREISLESLEMAGKKQIMNVASPTGGSPRPLLKNARVA
jgi:hypothetical protein